MNKSIHFYIKDPVFHSVCLFLVGDKEECNKIISKKIGCDEVITGECEGCVSEFTDNNTGAFIGRSLWIEKFDYTPSRLSYLAHEIAHLVDDNMERKGINPTNKSSETRAYMTQYWFEQFVYKYQKEHKKRNARKQKSTRSRRTSS